MAHKVRLAGCRVAALRACERLFQVGAGGFYRHGCLGLSITTSTYVRPCCMPTSLAASDNTLKRECGSKLPASLTQHTLAILYEGDVWRQSIDLTVTREAGQGRSVTRPTNTTSCKVLWRPFVSRSGQSKGHCGCVLESSPVGWWARRFVRWCDYEGSKSREAAASGCRRNQGRGPARRADGLGGAVELNIF
jgi:hypothetical protein